MEKQFNQCCADRSVRLNTSTGAVDCVNCGAADKYAGRAHCPCCGWRRLRRNVDGGAVECAKCDATPEGGELDGTVYEYSQAEHDALAAVLEAQMTDGQPCDKCGVYVPTGDHCGNDRADGTSEYLCPDCYAPTCEHCDEPVAYCDKHERWEHVNGETCFLDGPACGGE